MSDYPDERIIPKEACHECGKHENEIVSVLKVVKLMCKDHRELAVCVTFLFAVDNAWVNTSYKHR